MSPSSPGRESSYWPERSNPLSGREVREQLNWNLVRNRFPRRSDILSVFSIVVFACFTWSLIGFFNQLSSYILYFSIPEFTAIFSYMMAFALLESLAVTGFLVLLSALLPSDWLKNGFSYKGFAIIGIATVAAILFQRALPDEYPSIPMLAAFSIVPLVLAVFVIGLLHSMPRLQNIMINIQDRFLILLFIYVPIGLISLIAVTFRNLL